MSGTPDGLQFGVTGRRAIMRKDGSFSYVQPAEGDGPEVDGPNVLGDFFKPNVFASQQVGDIDPGGVPADPEMAIC